MNLFQKIWNKNFLKGKTSPEKLSEDLGGLQGTFSYISYKNGKQIDAHSFSNALTDLSKSTTIRLLAQGTTPWKGTIVPANYKISKMRFGNAEYSNEKNADLGLHYYKPSEISARGNSTENSSGYPYSPAGGRYLSSSSEIYKGPILADSQSNPLSSFSVSSFTNWSIGSNITIEFNNANFPAIVDKTVSPSHRSLYVQLFTTASPNTPTATLQFSNIYTRAPGGSASTSIANGNELYFNASTSAHFIYYDFSTNSWKLTFRLGTSLLINNITSFKVGFSIGKYNIINSIVPPFGYNTGSGGAAERFPLSSGIDYYNTSAPTYGNSAGNSSIDDYSATFSVTMGETQGNGVVGTGAPVAYTEAFLHNASDDLISIVRFPYPTAIDGKIGFEKTSDVAYLISWTIKALT
jgi:hypothetical protein